VEGERGHVNPKMIRIILNLEIVTVHRRSDSKRAYRSDAFFKINPDSKDKKIKNKSQSY
jgi:hypothetical protein